MKSIGATPSTARNPKGFFERSEQGDYCWELRPCRYCDVFQHPRIASPEIKKGSAFAFDNSGKYPNNKIHMLSGEHIDYPLAILNSRLVLWFASTNFSLLRGNSIEWKKPYMEDQSIPMLPEAERQPFIDIARAYKPARRARVDPHDAFARA